MSDLKPASVCIIGAGASGLATLKVLLERPDKWRPVVFEERDAIGGIWLPAAVVTDPEDLSHPPKSPLYDSLTTNLPHPVMAYLSYPLFPPETPLFPPAHTVLEYLQAFARRFDMESHIQLNVGVMSVQPLGGVARGPWKVSLSTGETQEFDCIVIANGRYRTPYIPALLLKGLQDRLHRGTALHASWFRNPLPYHGKRILVVGGGPSGVDISSACAPVCKQVWWAAAESVSTIHSDQLPGNVHLRGRITSLDDHDGDLNIVWADGSQEKLSVDFVILATGYELVYRFLDTATLEPIASVEPAFPFQEDAPSDHLFNTPQAVLPLAMHVFPLSAFPDPTLAFIGLPWKLAPFPIVEAQARAAAKVFERSILRQNDDTAAPPSPALNLEAERSALIARRNALLRGRSAMYAERMWHAIPEAEQVEYRRQLLKFANGSVTDDEEKEMQSFQRAYANKLILRQRWQNIEKRGEAEMWLSGIGYGAREVALQSWESLMDRIVSAGSDVDSRSNS